MFDRLLVPLDGSLPATAALVVAGHISGQLDTQLDVLAIGTGSPVEPTDELFEQQIARAGVTARLLSRPQRKSVADDIAAEALSTDSAGETLVVMQTWARGRTAGLVENTSEHVLKQTGRPLVVVGPESDRRIAPDEPAGKAAVAGDGWNSDGPLLIATDGSDFGDAAVAFAAELAARLNLEVELITVIDPSRVPAGVGVAAETNALTGPARTVEEITGRAVGYDALHGPHPADEIVAYARRRGASFLAMSTHGRAGLSRLAEDSVAMKVVRHAHCPVILTGAEPADPPPADAGQVHAVKPDTTPTDVLVGVDGSPGSELAVDWAAAKADVFGSVRPVAAFHMDALSDGIALPSLYQQVEKLLSEGASATLIKSLEDKYPDLLERSTVIEGYAGPALVRASTGERMLVVGSRGRSALAETLLGSVTSYCVKHSKVPVAVIPEGTPTDGPLDHLVVGIDGSENSAAALRWALTHVSENGRVTALNAWMPAPWVMEMIPPTPEMAANAEAMVDHLVKDVLATFDRNISTVNVSVEAELGDPRTKLAAAAAEADLLVVGARGHRGVTHLLVGSCTTSLIHHPTVATVVVPAGWPDQPAQDKSARD